jgi:lipid A 3-O-deacylase
MNRLAARIFVFGAILASQSAGAVETVHIGMLEHNAAVLNTKTGHREKGVNVEVQADFASLTALAWAGSPKPYVVASLNSSGDTSFVGGGLQWRLPIGRDWAINPGFGYVVHNGEVGNPFKNGDPRATEFSKRHVLLGSRDLFRSTIGVSRALSPTVSGEVFYSHLSHGQILGNGRNQGVDQIGLRVAYRLGN